MDFGQLIHSKLGSPSTFIRLTEVQVIGLQHDFERALLVYLLARFHGNQVKTAASMGINRNTLRKRIALHSVDVGAMRALYSGSGD